MQPAADSSDPSRDAVVLPFPTQPTVKARILAAPTDSELLDRCRARDPQAWDLLVARYERLIYTVALRNGVTPDDAADITQTTFVALIDSLDRIADDTKLASWLMTVSRRNAWRLRSGSRTVIPTATVPELPDDPMANWALHSAIHDALSTLGGTCRELLLALFFDPTEPSYAEVAQRFDRSVGAIGPMRGRCLERLRSIMADGEESL